ncbi:Protein of unknown function [Gryllus bimaculatus]|nr:Protein of unknown function [Gryllus bimaculatus]
MVGRGAGERKRVCSAAVAGVRSAGGALQEPPRTSRRNSSAYDWHTLAGLALRGEVQGARSEGPLKGRHVGEHHKRSRGRGGGGPAARHPPAQGPQQDVRHQLQRHRQVLAHHFPCLLRVLQPHVLDHLPAHQRRGGRGSGAARGGQVEERTTGEESGQERRSADGSDSGGGGVDTPATRRSYRLDRIH